MEPQHPPPTSTTTTATDSHSKLRFMCSYGGHITARPNFKSLFYAGGDTRIVAVDRRTTSSISSFIARLSSTLLVHQPFTIKYQLPHHDLDSLISVTTDDDLQIMFDEYDRLAADSSSSSSRLRLFIFPLKQPTTRSNLPAGVTNTTIRNSPLDSWFSDALKSAKIMRRKDESYCDDSTSVELRNESSMPESLMLETTSSFGSTSSSASSSNLPLIGVHMEEAGVNLQDGNVIFHTTDSILSNNSCASGISDSKIGINQDFVVNVELESDISRTSPTQVYRTVEVSGYPIPAQMPPHPHHHHQQQQQQQIQFVQASSHYTPHYPTGAMSSIQSDNLPPMYHHHQQQQQQQQQMQFVQASSHYTPHYPTGAMSLIQSDNLPPMYHHHPQLHYQTHYQPIQTYPIYLMPVSQNQQPFNLPIQNSTMIDTRNIAPSPQPMIHPNVTVISPPMAYKESVATAPMIAPELATKGANPIEQQLAGLRQGHHPDMKADNDRNEVVDADADDLAAYTLIYKSQPPAPSLLSQFRTLTTTSAPESIATIGGGFKEEAAHG